MIVFHPHAESCRRCEASAWEKVGEYTPKRGRREDVVECVFCGLCTRVEAAAVPVAATRHIDTDEFRFQFGRFKGMTFAEAEAEPNGRRYLEVMRDTNEKLRDRIEAYLAGTALDRPLHDREIVALHQQPEATECHERQASSQRLFG
jgi:methylphosphotriester-DNA--protein-cysteine methyltransferase